VKREGNGKMRKQKELLNTPFINGDKKSEGFNACASIVSQNAQVLYGTLEANPLCNQPVGH
jgi:hypothetical protein